MTHLLKMLNLDTQIKESGNILIPPPYLSPLPSFPSSSNSISSSQSSSSNGNKTSPIVLLIIVVFAIIFFVSGILHLLVRFLLKRPSFNSSVSLSNRQPNNNHNNNSSDASTVAIQRQLQQLFRLHDSGLDQALIDALPVFFYKDVMGLKEPFDCAVCLCEFSDQDKLRLLPLCSHAFHISCIDTWLLSNSTCPLCRGSLLSSGLENQEFSLDYWRELSFGRSINSEYDHCISSLNNGHSFNHSKPTIMEEHANERRVFSIRLGKFRNVVVSNEPTQEPENVETSTSASSTSQLDARRCFSLGSYQYVLAESNLEVALSPEIAGSSENDSGGKLEKNDNVLVNGDVEEKKISRRNRGDSFSVSKIWLWPKKSKLSGSSETNVDNPGPPSLNVVLPLSTSDHIP